MVRAGEMLTESMLGPVGAGFDKHEKGTRADLEGCLDAFGEPLTSFRIYFDPIDHGFDVMHLIATQAEGVFAFLLQYLPEIDDLAVHSGSNETLLLKAFGNLAMETLPTANHLTADHRSRARPSIQQHVHDLARAGRRDGLAADGALVVSMPTSGSAGTGVEQSKVVVDLCGCGDGRSRGVPAASLFDRDGGRKAIDRLEIGLPHLIEELPGVRGERLHVLPLAFRKDRVEGEGALSRAGDSGHDHQLIPGNAEIEVLEVVLPGAADLDEAGGRGRCGGQRRCGGGGWHGDLTSSGT